MKTKAKVLASLKISVVIYPALTFFLYVFTEHLSRVPLSTLSAHQAAQLQKHHIPIAEAPIARLEHQNGCLQNIHFKDGSQSPVQVLYARRPFVQHCDVPRALGCALTAERYIKVDASQKTTVGGVFACGDNTTRMRTVANAVAMGTTTGMMVNKELIEEIC